MTPLGSYIVQTLLTLLGVSALAVLVLVAGRRLGMGRPAGPLELVGRLPLDGRRAVYLVRVGGAVFVLGGSEAGLRKLGEVPEADLDLGPEQAPNRAGFGAVLERVMRRQRSVDREAENGDLGSSR